MKNRACIIPLVLLATTFVLTTTARAQYKETILVNFVGGGYGVYAAAIARDASGNIYLPVLTVDDGTCRELPCGAIVKLSPNASGTYTETINHSFTGGSKGNYPVALLADASGNLFGSTLVGGISGTHGKDCDLGCGVIFELQPRAAGGWTYTVLYRFPTVTDGDQPSLSLIDSAGNLYGWAAGGDSSKGLIFRLSPSSDGTWTKTTLYSFLGKTDGSFGVPSAIDVAGNVFGTVPVGGSTTTSCNNECGYIFELSPSISGTWTMTSVYNFNGAPDGAGPTTLITDGIGNLWGTTDLGGSALSTCTQYVPVGCGTLFELSPNSSGGWTETVQHRFAFVLDGAYPIALASDNSGNFYADLYQGGAGSYGTILKFESASGGGWDYTILHSFANGRGGGEPARMVVDPAAGDVYGALLSGGSKGDGAVYRLSPQYNKQELVCDPAQSHRYNLGRSLLLTGRYTL